MVHGLWFIFLCVVFCVSCFVLTCSGSGVRVSGFGFRVWGFVFRVWGLGFSDSCLGCGVWGFVFRDWVFGVGVSGSPREPSRRHSELSRGTILGPSPGTFRIRSVTNPGRVSTDIRQLPHGLSYGFGFASRAMATSFRTFSRKSSRLMPATNPSLSSESVTVTCSACRSAQFSI